MDRKASPLARHAYDIQMLRFNELLRSKFPQKKIIFHAPQHFVA